MNAGMWVFLVLEVLVLAFCGDFMAKNASDPEDWASLATIVYFIAGSTVCVLGFVISAAVRWL